MAHQRPIDGSASGEIARGKKESLAAPFPFSFSLPLSPFLDCTSAPPPPALESKMKDGREEEEREGKDETHPMPGRDKKAQRRFLDTFGVSVTHFVWKADNLLFGTFNLDVWGTSKSLPLSWLVVVKTNDLQIVCNVTRNASVMCRKARLNKFRSNREDIVSFCSIVRHEKMLLCCTILCNRRRTLKTF